MEQVGLGQPEYKQRPSWDEYFMSMARLASTRSTCLAEPVGAVVVKNNCSISTGYNGVPSGSVHCIDLGFCYQGLERCDAPGATPSRAVHAEANAIAQAAKHGVSTDGASIYVTHEPCISCLKLIIAAGIQRIYFEKSFNSGVNAGLRDLFLKEGLIMEFKKL